MQKGVILTVILAILWLADPGIYAQNKRQASLEKESLEYFNNRQYARALEGYRQLLGSFPKDPWYNYYTGVCLTELKQDPSMSLYRLKTASLGKDIPPDVYFYLGKASYQAGLYRDAIDYFTRFREQAGSAGSKSYHVDKWITQSRMYLNNPQGDRSGQMSGTTGTAGGYQQVANRALEYQHKADSVRLLTYQKENRMRSAVDDEREQIRKDIKRLNDQADAYQREADRNFTLARKYEKEGNMNTAMTAQNYQSKAGDTQVLSPAVRLPAGSAAPFLEMTGDDFYRQPEFRKVFAPQDIEALDKYHELNLRGNGYMKDALSDEREIAVQQMIVNTSPGGKTRKKAQQKINKLEEQKMQKRLKAVDFFREANDGEYALNKRYIETFELHSDLDAAQKKQGATYKKEAILSYNKALILRKKATNYLNYSSKYDLLMEANAYELAALDAQRKAIATYAGLIPASAAPDLVHAAVAPPKAAPAPAAGEKVVTAKPAKATAKAAAGPPVKAVVKPAPEEKVLKPKTTAPADKKAAHEEMLSKYVFGFEMADSAHYPSVNDIPGVNDMPPGVNYRIQVGVFKNPPEISYFQGMYPMVAEKIPDKKLVRFYTGLFRTYGQAAAVLLKLREKGYKDAIIVGFYNGKKASVSRIQWLEDQDPYSNIKPAAVRPQTQKIVAAEGTKKQGLSLHQEKELLFRVQLGVFREPLPPEKLRELEQFTEKSYVVIRTTNNQGLYVYAIGNFTTFGEAKAFRNKLAELGVSGCFVTAYKKGVRVPLSEIEGI